MYEINPDSPVQSFYISSPEDFYNAWNSMGFEDGKEVKKKIGFMNEKKVSEFISE